MRVFGLTGGIAAGKSVVLARLAELGAVVIDADLLARDAVAPGSAGLRAVVEAFGPGVLADDGSLDRAALGDIVFADADARHRLNAIVHPEVRRLGDERIASAAAVDPDVRIVYDIPLLVESGPARAAGFDAVVVVTAPEQERVRRMTEDRGMSEVEARRRIAAQATDAQRLAIADHVIDNGGPIEATVAQVDALWAQLGRGVGGAA